MSKLQLPITPTNRPYWEGLEQGELRYLQCNACQTKWLPARGACPNCLSRDIAWQKASGRGNVVSWVVYHRAYADHLASRIPYDVTLVQLEEGPRMLTNIVDSDAGKRLAVGLAVELAIEREDDVAVARFRCAAGDQA